MASFPDAAGPNDAGPKPPRRTLPLLTFRDAREWLLTLTRAAEPPERTAAAFALGVFIGFSPFLGLQTLSALAATVLFRLNRVAVLVGLLTNLPWVIVPWYVLTTTAGAALLGVPLDAAALGTGLQQLFELPVYTAAFWGRAVEFLSPLLGAFLLGSTLGASGLAVVAYFGMLMFLRRCRRPS